MRQCVLTMAVLASFSLMTTIAEAQSGSRSGGGFLGSGSRGYAPQNSTPAFSPNYGGQNYGTPNYGVQNYGGQHQGYSQPSCTPSQSGCGSHYGGGYPSTSYAPAYHRGGCGAAQQVQYPQSGYHSNCSSSSCAPVNSTIHAAPQTHTPLMPIAPAHESIMPQIPTETGSPSPMEHGSPPIPLGSVTPVNEPPPTTSNSYQSQRLVRTTIKVPTEFPSRNF